MSNNVSLSELYDMSEEEAESANSFQLSMHSLQEALKGVITEIQACRHHCRIASQELGEINDSIKKS